MADREIWFEYVQVPGRFSAIPVNWKGWVALIAIVTVPTAALLGFGLPYLRVHKYLIGPAVILDLAVCFAITFWLVFAKGRRRA